MPVPRLIQTYRLSSDKDGCSAIEPINEELKLQVGSWPALVATNGDEDSATGRLIRKEILTWAGTVTVEVHFRKRVAKPSFVYCGGEGQHVAAIRWKFNGTTKIKLEWLTPQIASSNSMQSSRVPTQVSQLGRNLESS